MFETIEGKGNPRGSVCSSFLFLCRPWLPPPTQDCITKSTKRRRRRGEERTKGIFRDLARSDRLVVGSTPGDRTKTKGVYGLESRTTCASCVRESERAEEEEEKRSSKKSSSKKQQEEKQQEEEQKEEKQKEEKRREVK